MLSQTKPLPSADLVRDHRGPGSHLRNANDALGRAGNMVGHRARQVLVAAVSFTLTIALVLSCVFWISRDSGHGYDGPRITYQQRP